MPDVPIVDSHLHLWDPAHFPMPWLAGNQLLERRYDLGDYRAHTAGLPIAAMVYLQVDVDPAYALMEARWAAARADVDPRLGAIVPWAPVEQGERVRPFLEALTTIDPRIVGVRRIVQGEPDPDFARLPGFVAGVQALDDYGLSFDICLHHQQLPASIELVRRCPQVRFVLDHVGKPAIKDHLLDPWRAQIRELAALPNVCCKVSGVVTEADPDRWTADDVAPYVAHVLEAFGEDRVMFGGDWPVVLGASSYARWVETLDALTVGLTPGARRKLWGDNARRFYRMDRA